MSKYEYQSLIWVNGQDQAFHEWLNKHCANWDIIHIGQLTGNSSELTVTMRRPLPLPVNDEISAGGYLGHRKLSSHAQGKALAEDIADKLRRKGLYA